MEETNGTRRITSTVGLDGVEKRTPKNAWDSDNEESDDEKDSKLAVSVAVGHIAKEKPASIRFDIAASGEGVGVSSTTANNTNNNNNNNANTNNNNTKTPSRPNTGQSQTSRPPSQARGQTASSHIRLYAKQVLDDAFRTASPEWCSRYSEKIKVFGSTTWVDLKLNPDASEILIAKLIDQLEKFLDSVPRDYARPLYTATKVEEVSMGSRGIEDKYIRLIFLCDRDPFDEYEKILPPGTHPKDIIEKLSLHFEFNITLEQILKLTSQFLDFEGRCFGPQEDELGEKGMEPAQFVNTVKQRRKAALRAAKKIQKKEMPLEEIKEHLELRGYSTKGSIIDIRERAEEMFLVQAEVCGYGELSNFGESIANAIFKRVDRDNDGAVNFHEMNALHCILAHPPLRKTSARRCFPNGKPRVVQQILRENKSVRLNHLGRPQAEPRRLRNLNCKTD